MIVEDDPILFCDWDECVKRIATVEPETEPGCKQIYHYLSYGWLCGAIIEVTLHTSSFSQDLYIFNDEETIFIFYINKRFIYSKVCVPPCSIFFRWYKKLEFLSH